MFHTFEQARRYMDDYHIQMADMKFCDLWGRWHHLTVPASQFTPELMEKGIGFDGSAVGLKSVKAGDMVLVPDLTTAMRDPFWEAATLSFICTTLEADTHDIFTNDPRNIAIRAEAYLRAAGHRRREPLGTGVRVLHLRQRVAMSSGSTAPATGSTAPRPIGTAPRAVTGTTSRCTAATMPSRPRTSCSTCAPK